MWEAFVPRSGIGTSAGREAAMPSPFQVLSGLGFTLVAFAALAQSSREGRKITERRKKERREGNHRKK